MGSFKSSPQDVENLTVSGVVVADKIGINDSAPKTAFNVIHNYQATTFESQLTDGQGGGEKLLYSPGANDTLTAGQIYFMYQLPLVILILLLHLEQEILLELLDMLLMMTVVMFWCTLIRIRLGLRLLKHGYVLRI
jgi:hypothetical protein